MTKNIQLLGRTRMVIDHAQHELDRANIQLFEAPVLKMFGRYLPGRKLTMSLWMQGSIWKPVFRSSERYFS